MNLVTKNEENDLDNEQTPSLIKGLTSGHEVTDLQNMLCISKRIVTM